MVSELAADYAEARRARAAWAEAEKDTKAKLLEALGYDPDDSKPEPTTVEDTNGEVLKVKRGTWRGLNQKALRAERPDIYALYETSKATLTVSFPETATDG